MFLRKLPAGESLRYIYVGHISIFTGVFLARESFFLPFFPRLISCPFFLGILGIIPKSNSLTFNKWEEGKKKKAAPPALDPPRANAFQGR